MTTTSMSTEAFSSHYSSAYHSFTRRHSIYGTEDRVVIDIGSLYLKCGFSGESQPRHILPTWSRIEYTLDEEEGEAYRTNGAMMELYDLDLMSKGNLDQLQEKLRKLLHMIYFRLLLTDPKSRKVIVCESPLAPVALKQTVAKLLFEYFQVPSLSFVPVHFAGLLTTGMTTGLVIDVGHLETSVLPIYATRPLIPFVTTTPLAGRAITRNLRQLLKEHARFIPPTHLHLSLAPFLPVPDSVLTEERLEDIKTRVLLMIVPTAADTMEMDEDNKERSTVSDLFYPIPMGAERATLQIPGWIREKAAQVLFEGDEEDEPSITHVVLDALIKLQPDLRTPLVSSLLLIGGSVMLPGFQSRFKHELLRILNEPTPYEAKRYRPLLQLTRHVAFVSSTQSTEQPFPPNVRGWVGASLLGSLKLSGVETTREKFNGTVQDWSIGHWADTVNAGSSMTATNPLPATLS